MGREWQVDTEYSIRDELKKQKKTMPDKSKFDIDCHDIIPECGYQCDECISEMESTFKKIKGVTNFHLEKQSELQLVVIEHEPEEFSVEQLMETFRQLPSRYKGYFKPTLFKG